MKLKYTEGDPPKKGLKLARLPIIGIKLETPQFNGGDFDYLCLIDSGADFCVFSAEIGELMGLSIKDGKEIKPDGIKKGQPIKAYLHDIVYKVNGSEYKAQVAFTYEVSSRYGILGREGFFNYFFISFDDRKNEIELIPYHKKKLK